MIKKRAERESHNRNHRISSKVKMGYWLQNQRYSIRGGFDERFTKKAPWKPGIPFRRRAGAPRTEGERVEANVHSLLPAPIEWAHTQRGIKVVRQAKQKRNADWSRVCNITELKAIDQNTRTQHLTVVSLISFIVLLSAPSLSGLPRPIGVLLVRL